MPKSIVPFFPTSHQVQLSNGLHPSWFHFFQVCVGFILLFCFFFVCFFVCLFSSPPCLRRKHHKATPVLQCC